jgi:hypothetical protein
VVIRCRRDSRFRSRSGAGYFHVRFHLRDGQPRAGAGRLRRQAQARSPVHQKERPWNFSTR